jgi:hypothetical protein
VCDPIRSSRVICCDSMCYAVWIANKDNTTEMEFSKSGTKEAMGVEEGSPEQRRKNQAEKINSKADKVNSFLRRMSVSPTSSPNDKKEQKPTKSLPVIKVAEMTHLERFLASHTSKISSLFRYFDFDGDGTKTALSSVFMLRELLRIGFDCAELCVSVYIRHNCGDGSSQRPGVHR